MNALTLRLLATVAFVGTLVMNALANLLPINGLNTGQVSALYPSLFTPAGITFSIWTVIYILLAGFIVLSWLRRDDRPMTRILPWFIVSCVLNMSWILVWHYLLVDLSVVVMLVMLTVQIVLFRMIHRQYLIARVEQILIALPFTIYLAWICVATIANISAWLTARDWQGGAMSPETWTVVMMSIAAVLAGKVTVDYRTPFFSVVVMWALLGIYIRWHGTDHKQILASALVLIAALVVVVVLVSRRHVRA